MVLTKEEQIFLRHLKDLQKTSVYKQSEVFSDFLSVRETAILKTNIAGLPDGRLFLFGGIDEAERLMACFAPSFIPYEDIHFPIRVLKIKLIGLKFQKTLPKHSDFLGAILGLGIERRLIGDIYVDHENAVGYVFCIDGIADFIISELTSVGRTKVEVSYTESGFVTSSWKIESRVGTVSSLRPDVMIGEVFHISRGKVKELFLADKVILNGSLSSSLHSTLKEGDIISVRGYGKFVFQEILGNTKKDKIRISYGIYS